MKIEYILVSPGWYHIKLFKDNGDEIKVKMVPEEIVKHLKLTGFANSVEQQPKIEVLESEVVDEPKRWFNIIRRKK